MIGCVWCSQRKVTEKIKRVGKSWYLLGAFFLHNQDSLTRELLGVFQEIFLQYKSQTQMQSTIFSSKIIFKTAEAFQQPKIKNYIILVEQYCHQQKNIEDISKNRESKRETIREELKEMT